MPLTPLHLAVGLPMRDAAKKRFSIVSFILINCLIDVEPVTVILMDLGKWLPVHGGFHTLAGATILGAFVGIWRFWSVAWWAGAIWGAWSHVLLDSLCHHDVKPFHPWIDGNPFYIDAHGAVTLICAGVLTFYLARWVQSLRVGERFARWRAGSRA